MANTLEIKKISTASVSAADICRVLDEANIGFVAVDNHCWAEAFPYRPTMEVRMAHNGMLRRCVMTAFAKASPPGHATIARFVGSEYGIYSDLIN